jgi:hypothetical protein
MSDRVTVLVNNNREAQANSIFAASGKSAARKNPSSPINSTVSGVRGCTCCQIKPVKINTALRITPSTSPRAWEFVSSGVNNRFINKSTAPKPPTTKGKRRKTRLGSDLVIRNRSQEDEEEEEEEEI